MSLFDPKIQQSDVSAKVVVALERVSEAFKSLLWEKAKDLGLSPIQIQILIFVKHHDMKYSNVSYLAKEFHVTKPTVSDAVKALEQKGLISKEQSLIDSRSYTIRLTDKGAAIVQETQDFSDEIKNSLGEFPKKTVDNMYAMLMDLIGKMTQTGLLTVQRTCFACSFYEQSQSGARCNLLKMPLQTTDLRIDCPEFEESV